MKGKEKKKKNEKVKDVRSTQEIKVIKKKIDERLDRLLKEFVEGEENQELQDA